MNGSDDENGYRSLFPQTTPAKATLADFTLINTTSGIWVGFRCVLVSEDV